MAIWFQNLEIQCFVSVRLDLSATEGKTLLTVSLDVAAILLHGTIRVYALVILNYYMVHWMCGTQPHGWWH